MDPSLPPPPIDPMTAGLDRDTLRRDKDGQLVDDHGPRLVDQMRAKAAREAREHVEGLPADGPRRYADTAMHLLTTTHQRMTAAEFEALPEGPPYFELVNGELFFMPSPTRQHQKLVLRFAFTIEAHLRTHLVGEVYVAPSDVKLSGEDVFEPDVYFVSRERLGILTKQGATGAPDLVVEVLSPSTARLDRGRKRAVYFREGVREVWFVWPDSQRVDVHLPGDIGGEEPARTLGISDTLTTPLLPGWSVPLAELFG